MAAARDVIVINADYQQLGATSFKKAMRLLVLGKAVVHEADESRERLRDWDFPKVIRLVGYAKVNYKRLYGAPSWSKTHILRRDRYKCGYCGSAAKTIDHIKPRSRCLRDGENPNTWKNTVAACFSCNNRKDNRTPVEANMPLKITPYVPTKAELIANR